MSLKGNAGHKYSSAVENLGIYLVIRCLFNDCINFLSRNCTGNSRSGFTLGNQQQIPMQSKLFSKRIKLSHTVGYKLSYIEAYLKRLDLQVAKPKNMKQIM